MFKVFTHLYFSAMRCLIFRHLTNIFTLIFFVAITLLGRESRAQSHPQHDLFGNQTDFVYVGTNPQATIRLINPVLEGVDFGQFSIPTYSQFLVGNYNQTNLKNLLGVGRKYTDEQRQEFVPPETGRGILLPPSTNEVYRDILIKGTGAVEKFTSDNQLRFATLGFDGLFEISESVRDMVTSEVLHNAGVMVSRGLVIIDHNELAHRNGISEPLRMGNYVRSYRVQTRLSNLVKLTSEQRKAAIDDAIERLAKINHSSKKMNYVEYFTYMTQKLARNIAIYQAIGFTQDSLHFGQVTLAGEMTDLGVGSFERPKEKGEINTKYPWFRYERQPVLIQNMLYRSHSVKAEPNPVELSPDSKTITEQNTLFSYIKSFAPEAAAQIESVNPIKMFWEAYSQYYRNFDSDSFSKNAMNKIKEIYEWSPENLKLAMSPDQKDKIIKEYNEEFQKYAEGIYRPNRSGATLQITSLEKQRLFLSILRRNRYSISSLSQHFKMKSWPFNGDGNNYIEYTNRNPEIDISWKPDDLDSYYIKKFGPHPLARYLKPGNYKLEVGQKIIWMTEDGVSPFAIIRNKNIAANTYTISFENPRTNSINEIIVPHDKLLKLNDPDKSIQVNDIISGTRISLGNQVKSKLKKMEARIEQFRPNPDDSSDDIKSKQVSTLHELISSAYTHYITNLDPENQDRYSQRLKQRLNSANEVMTLDWAMVQGCGNCMDQNLLTSTLLAKISKDYGLKYNAYIAQEKDGGKHFFTIVTLLPSQEQYFLDSSFSGLRLFPLRQGTLYSKFPITNIIDQHKPQSRPTTMQCESVFMLAN